uniref:Uncharacterized protein n=1 Tax=Arundo donax TaxID=35708 RepID=A0A0A8ZGK3_ARUDO
MDRLSGYTALPRRSKKHSISLEVQNTCCTTSDIKISLELLAVLTPTRLHILSK